MQQAAPRDGGGPALGVAAGPEPLEPRRALRRDVLAEQDHVDPGVERGPQRGVHGGHGGPRGTDELAVELRGGRGDLVEQRRGGVGARGDDERDPGQRQVHRDQAPAPAGASVGLGGHRDGDDRDDGPRGDGRVGGLGLGGGAGHGAAFQPRWT